MLFALSLTAFVSRENDVAVALATTRSHCFDSFLDPNVRKDSHPKRAIGTVDCSAADRLISGITPAHSAHLKVRKR